MSFLQDKNMILKKFLGLRKGPDPVTIHPLDPPLHDSKRHANIWHLPHLCWFCFQTCTQACLLIQPLSKIPLPWIHFRLIENCSWSVFCFLCSQHLSKFQQNTLHTYKITSLAITIEAMNIDLQCIYFTVYIL